ncbi:MAG: hypothetical protein IJL62_03680 [Clostridia bacterium]|nr:hypothetical protein [Clostridia bacterium]
MRKIILPLAALLALLLLFGVGLYELVFASGAPAFSEEENRMLAERPSLSLASLADGTFTDAFEKFLSDRFPGRTGMIRASQELRQIGSFASWDDYVQVAENDAADMEFQQELPEEEAIVTPRPARTAAPTEIPTPEPTAPAATEAAGSDAPVDTPEPTPVPEPTASPRPKKAPANVSAFPDTLRCKLLSGETNRDLYRCQKSALQKICTLFDAYASLLPEDGIFAVTIVPYSSAANRLMTYKNPKGFTSDVEPFIEAVTADNVAAFCAVDLLCEPLMQGEYVFFRTDIHWTPYGAHKVVSRMMEEAGEMLPPYESFPREQEDPFLGTIYRNNPTKQMKNHPDTLDILTPAKAVRVRRYTTPDKYAEIPFIDRNAPSGDRYKVYLGGPNGNLTVIEQTGEEIERPKTCFLITDSYGLCTAPFFAEVYDRVLVYDPRFYNKNQMGSVSGIIEQYGVTDIYLIVGDLHAFDDSYFKLCNNHF